MERPEFRSPFKDGKIIGKNIDSADYHNQTAKRGSKSFVMSRSELMLFASNPSRWVAGYATKETDATKFGSLMDCLVTDWNRFESKYAVQPQHVKATSSMKCVKTGEAEEGTLVEWRDCVEARDWNEANAAKEILSYIEHRKAEEACARLMMDEKIAKLIKCSDKQVMVTADYHDRKTDIVIPVKVLIDFAPAKDSLHANDLADYKTCRNAALGPWVKVIDDRNYDCQAALFLDVYNAATGEDRYCFLHVLQENLFPWEPGRRLLSMEFLHNGRVKYMSALSLYCQCLLADQWPSWDRDWTLCEPTPYMVERMTRGSTLEVIASSPPPAETETDNDVATP